MSLLLPIGLLFSGLLLFNTKKGSSRMLSANQITKIKSRVKSLYPDINFSKWNVIGIRGGKISEGNIQSIPNIRNQFNDLLILIKDSKAISFPGNLEPGNPSMVKPMVSEGTFQLSNGRYNLTRTTHGRNVVRSGKSVKIRENAFNLSNAKGQRDKNQDGKFDSKDPLVNLDYRYGINLHAINRKNPQTVDQASYGCINIQSYWDDPLWTEFRDTLYSDKAPNWSFVVLDSKEVLI
jgi:hypothetical protein